MTINIPMKAKAFEKVLILGGVLRNHLKQLLLTETQTQDPSLKMFLSMIDNF